MRYDSYTGKPVDLPYPWATSNGGTCDDCGHYTIDRCLMCGAPQCCPRCCVEMMREEEGNIDGI